MAAILKFSKRHLPNGKSDWAETWWEVSGQLNIQNCSIHSVSISRMAAILNFLYDISRTESQFVLVLDGRYRGDTNIQNCSIRSISISKMATILKFFKRHLTQDRKSDWAETCWTVSGRHGDSALLKSFRSDIQDGPWRPSLNYLNDISSLTEIRIELTLDGRYRGDMEIQNC